MFIDSSIFLSLFVCVGIAMVAGVLGCFILWQRISYFSDSLSQSSFLAISLCFLYDLNLNIVIFLVCSFFSFILVFLSYKKILPFDSILGILSSFILSVAIIVFSFTEKTIDLQRYLFGSLELLELSDLYLVYIGGLFIIIFIALNWSSLILSTIDEDLAKAENINVFLLNFFKMIFFSVFVVLSVRFLGILLITSILLLPAATSRQIAKSPEIMAIISSFLAGISMVAGVFISEYFQIYLGPVVVIISVFIFIFLVVSLKIRNLCKA